MPDVVGLSGLEPPTSRLSGERSNQLSYRPGGIALPTSTPCAVGAERRRGRTMEGKGGSRPVRGESLCSLSAARSCSLRLATLLPLRLEQSRAPSNESVRKEVIQPQVPLRL